MAISKLSSNSVIYDLKSSAPSGTIGEVYYNSTDKALKVHDGDAWQAIGGGAFSVTAKTADYTVLAADCDGTKGFANVGATTSIIFTLPSAVAGYKVTILNMAGFNVQIIANTADDITMMGMSLGRDVRNKTGVMSLYGGSMVNLYAVNATEWLALQENIVQKQKNYGFVGGGYGTDYTNTLYYLDTTTTTSGASSRGTITTSRSYSASGVYSDTWGYTCGGLNPTKLSTIEFYDVTVNTGNATVSANLSATRYGLGGGRNDTYGYFFGGADSAGTKVNIIERFGMTTNTMTASDVGDLTVSSIDIVATCGQTYAYPAGGSTAGGIVDTVYYVDLTLGKCNTASKGTLSAARYAVAGINGSVYGFYCGGDTGSRSDVIDYINITTTTGNATDRGNLSSARAYASGVNGPRYGFMVGGSTTESVVDIDYLDLSVLTNGGLDKGDLPAARAGAGGV